MLSSQSANISTNINGRMRGLQFLTTLARPTGAPSRNTITS